MEDENELEGALEASWGDVGEAALGFAEEYVPGGSHFVQAMELLWPERRFDKKMRRIEWKWLIDDVPATKKIVERIETLAEEHGATLADIAATLEAIDEVSRKTTNPSKRQLLRNAAVNAFDPEMFEEGMTRLYLKAIETLEYGDIDTLRMLYSVSNSSDLEGVRRVSVGGRDADVNYMPRHHAQFGGMWLRRLTEHECIYGPHGNVYQISHFGCGLLDFLAEPEELNPDSDD